MDKTKPKVKEVQNETREQRFLRIAPKRATKILKNIRILGNCANKSSYSYTQEQIDKLFDAIYESIDRAKLKFIPNKESQDSFEFK